MISVKLEGFDDIIAKLSGIPRQVEIASQRALIKTAQAVKDAEIAEMKRVFTSPTPWTIGAIRVKPVSNFTVKVGVVDPDGYYKRAANYLGTQIVGGQRKQKAMEKALQQYGLMPSGWFAVPGAGAKLDSYGNMSAGQIRQILSWFDAAERWSGSTQNMGVAGREKRRKGTRRNVGFEYFVVLPGKQRNLKQPGIYQRFFFAQGKAIKPVLIYIKAPRYQIRFNFEKVANEVVSATWRAEFSKAIKSEMSR